MTAFYAPGAPSGVRSRLLFCLMLAFLLPVVPGNCLPTILPPDSSRNVPVVEVLLTSPARVRVQASPSATFAYQAYARGRVLTDSTVSARRSAQGVCLFMEEPRATVDTLSVTVPASHQVRIMGAKNHTEISGLQSHLEADLAEGDLSVRNHRGGFQLHTAKGNLSLRQVQGSGSASTLTGNVLLEDVSEGVGAFTKAGTITTRYTSAYTDKLTTPWRLDIGYPTGLEIEKAPRSTAITLTEGNILVKQAADSLKAHTQSGNITVEAASGAVQAFTGKGNIVVYLTQTASTAGVELVSEEGEVTLYLPEDLSAEVQVNYYGKDAKFQVESEFTSKSQVKKTADAVSAAVGKQQWRQTLNGGKRSVQLHVMSGKIRLKKAK